jgi:2-polyprenyl-3-methyl-5-hydroxy-6-metoxy-1,4-benzoquinol methylase
MGNFNEAYKQWLFHEKIHLIVKARDKKGDEWSEKQVSDYAPIHKFIDLYSILSWKGRSVELEARATENTPEGWMTKEWIALDDFVTDTWGTLIKAQLSVPPFFIDDTLPSGVMYAVKEDGIYFNKQDILRLGAKSDIINVWWSAYEAWYEDNLTHHFNKFVPEQPTGYYSRKTFDERVQVVRNGIHEVELRLKDKAVLDVGTGDGPVAIAAALEGANPVCAIDPSEKGLNLARQNATRHSLTIKFLCLGLTNLSSLPLRQFDVAIVRNTLAYMPAELRKRAIMRIKDKIVPDGQIVIYENFDMREKAWRGKEWQHFLLECGLILVDTKVIISPSSGFPVSIIIVTKKSEKTSDSGGAEAIKPHSVRKMLTRPDELGFNPSAYDASSRLGGVYFGALPIINLADFNFDSFAAAPTVMPALNINKEFEEIQKLITANIRPSRQRIAEYLYACTHTQPSPFSLNYALSCIADVLRLEEE